MEKGVVSCRDYAESERAQGPGSDVGWNLYVYTVPQKPIHIDKYRMHEELGFLRWIALSNCAQEGKASGDGVE
jgi:hypothetical protein